MAQVSKVAQAVGVLVSALGGVALVAAVILAVAWSWGLPVALDAATWWRVTVSLLAIRMAVVVVVPGVTVRRRG